MNVAHFVPPAKGTFRCRICKKPGTKTTANQKVHRGACLRKAKLIYESHRGQGKSRSSR